MSSRTATCPICAAPSSECFGAGAFIMYRCSACATAFVDPMPDAAYLTKFYSGYHAVAGEDGSYGMEQKMVAKHPFQVSLVEKAADGKVGRLLDVGCGKGFFVAEAIKA